MIVAFSLVAALQVILESGVTVPIAPYYQALDARMPSITAPPPPVYSPSVFSLASLLPITTPTLSPGMVAARAVNQAHLVRPLFLIGSDVLSLTWLRQHHERLQHCHAVGIAVEIPDSQSWERMTQVAHGLPLIPMSGTMITRQFQLTHYPVLIEPYRIGS